MNPDQQIVDISNLYDQVRELYMVFPESTMRMQMTGVSYKIYIRQWGIVLVSSGEYVQYLVNQITINNHINHPDKLIIPMNIFAMPMEQCTKAKHYIDQLLQIYHILLQCTTLQRI